MLNSLLTYRNSHPQLGLPLTYEEFSQTSIVTYEQLHESGFIDVLKTKSDITCVLRTGGTSSLSHKTLPTSDTRFMHNDRKVSQALFVDVIRHCGPLFLANILTDKIVFLCGNRFEDGQIPVRYVSNALVSNKGRLGDRICPVPQSINDGIDLPDNHSKLLAIAACYHGRNPAVISGVPSVIIQFALVWKELYRIPLQTKVLIVGGCRISPYVEQLQGLFGTDVVIIPYYNATEATIGYQPSALRNSDDYDTLMLKTDAGVYYEFTSQHDTSKIISLDQILADVPYRLIISTYDGLCRYQIGDLVEFSDVSKYYFRIIGRTSEYIDIANEHMQIQHVQGVVEALRGTYNIGPYCVYPEDDEGVWRYVWVIESSTQDQTLIEDMITHFDLGLQSANDNYAAKRRAHTLGDPRIQIISPSTFEQIITDLNHRKHSTQSKLLTLYPHPQNPVSEYINTP